MQPFVESAVIEVDIAVFFSTEDVREVIVTIDGQEQSERICTEAVGDFGIDSAEWRTYGPFQVEVPTLDPTNVPTNLPTASPTALPTFLPSKVPTQRPSKTPTWFPTVKPTFEPTTVPSDSEQPTTTRPAKWTQSSATLHA